MEMLVVWQMEQVLWWSYRVPLKAQKDVKDRRWVDLAHTKYIFRLSYHSTNRWYSFLGYCTIVLESVGLDFDSEHAEYPASNSLCRLVLAPHPRNICWFTLPTSSNIFQHIPTIQPFLGVENLMPTMKQASKKGFGRRNQRQAKMEALQQSHDELVQVRGAASWIRMNQWCMMVIWWELINHINESMVLWMGIWW